MVASKDSSVPLAFVVSYLASPTSGATYRRKPDQCSVSTHVLDDSLEPVSGKIIQENSHRKTKFRSISELPIIECKGRGAYGFCGGCVRCAVNFGCQPKPTLRKIAPAGTRTRAASLEGLNPTLGSPAQLTDPLAKGVQTVKDCTIMMRHLGARRTVGYLLSAPGIEPGSGRPQRPVLTTRRCRRRNGSAFQPVS